MRILGLDIGSKTIGVAVSDPLGWTAQGVTTIHRKDRTSDLKDIEGFISRYEVEKILVGLPLRMDGTEGDQAAKIQRFAALLKEHFKNMPVILWDERLSTVAAERTLLEADLSRAKRKKVINQMAAVFILQGYLDSQQQTGLL